MSKSFWRPLVQTGGHKPSNARSMPTGGGWFTHVEKTRHGTEAQVVPLEDAPKLPLPQPQNTQIMGILNVTPDSFSDGGQLSTIEKIVARAKDMTQGGTDILDIGGESTRPGAAFVTAEDEIARVVPAIQAIKAEMPDAQISVDTRKADVAEVAIAAGAMLFNDVSALSFDPRSAEVAAKSGVKVCLMHAQGDPKTMQDSPSYAAVLHNVFDYLEERRDFAIAHGVKAENIILDPGIGFGKTLEHNRALLQGLALFQTLGCSVLLGASRKRFIGEVTGVDDAKDRVAGSLAVALDGARQGAQIIRVHDVAETRQALDMQQFLTG